MRSHSIRCSNIVLPILSDGVFFSRIVSPSKHSPKRPRFLSRLTTKLGITASPVSAPDDMPSSNRLSPTRLDMARQSNPFFLQELRQAPSNDHPMKLEQEATACVPKDLRVGDWERHLSCVRQDSGSSFSAESGQGDQNITEAKRIQEEWRARNLGFESNIDVMGASPSSTVQRRKGPLYPDVLATPQFGKSKSTPNLTLRAPPQLKTSPDHLARNDFAAIQGRSSTFINAPNRASPQELLLPSISDQRLRYESSPQPSRLPPPPGIPKWPGPPPTRNIPSVPTYTVTSQSSLNALACSSKSSEYNSFAPAPPFASINQYPGQAVDNQVSPPSLKETPNCGAGSESSRMGSVGQCAGAANGDDFCIPLATLDIKKKPTVVRSGRFNTYPADSLTVELEGGDVSDDEIAKLLWPAKATQSLTAPSTPNTVEPPRTRSRDREDPVTPHVTGRRRKSFVGQSLHSLRKSLTETISKARPKSPKASSNSLSIPSGFDASHLPPSPTLPTFRRADYPAR